MSMDTTLVAALVATLTSMGWFLLREIRASVNGLAREISDLTVAIAIDIATRPSANAATRELAGRLVNDRDAIRARERKERG